MIRKESVAATLCLPNGEPVSVRKLTRRLRIAFTLLGLFAFATQSFVAQTHVHAHRLGDATAFTAHASASLDGYALQPNPDSGKQGKGGGPVCPLCQVVLHGSAVALLPTLSSLPELGQSRVRLLSQQPSSLLAAISYHWQSRAPPRS